MLYYNRIDITEKIDPTKSNKSKVTTVFLIMGSNFKLLYAMVAMMLSVNISDFAIVTVKDVDHRCIIHNISKSEAINLLENYLLEDPRYI